MSANNKRSWLMFSHRLGHSLGLVALAVGAACYGNVTLGGNVGDAGPMGSSVGPGSSGGTTVGGSTGPGTSTGSTTSTGSASSTGSVTSTGSVASTGSGTGTTAVAYVDAGYYRGDGSYFVEGGAYPDVGTLADGSTRDGGIDASPGCQSLAACCGTLAGASQSLCDTVASSGNATNCSAELTQLQAGGDCMGVSVLASQVQVTPNRLVSDGTTLFWTTYGDPGLLAMPVGGGAITTLLSGPVGPWFLAVDSVNLYVESGCPCGWNLIRIPKNGSAASLVNASENGIGAATTLATTVYWTETVFGNQYTDAGAQALRGAPLLGGPASLLAIWRSPNEGMPGSELGVTSTTAFVADGFLGEFRLSTGVPDGGPAAVATGANCESLTSDSNAVYCATSSGSNVRFADDGTVTTLGPAVTSSYIVFDDTYVYWADMTSVGTIMRAPKTGGGTASVIARDANPTAIAVDANSVYWSDAAGYIKSVAK